MYNKFLIDKFIKLKLNLFASDTSHFSLYRFSTILNLLKIFLLSFLDNLLNPTSNLRDFILDLLSSLINIFLINSSSLLLSFLHFFLSQKLNNCFNILAGNSLKISLNSNFFNRDVFYFFFLVFNALISLDTSNSILRNTIYISHPYKRN